MQISYQYQGKWHIKQLSAEVVTVGRPNNREGIHIDLSPDTTVSRLHARVWLENGVCWLEDLGSRYGTQVNGAQITGRVQLQAGDAVEIGETTLRVDPSPEG
ncbi:MAG: FHA domain-containing protein [Verrucomicrobia subdivision 3 bacterium]|nr:FHA domain-containing protein [Limisphaerales bacterium]